MKEKDIETAFIKWMHQVPTAIYLGRQVITPAGIIDCLFWNQALHHPIVVEVKKGKTPSNVFAQLTAYMNYVAELIMSFTPFGFIRGRGIPFRMDGVIVAESLDKMTARAISNNGFITFVQYTETPEGISFKIQQGNYIWAEIPNDGGALDTVVLGMIDLYRMNKIMEVQPDYFETRRSDLSGGTKDKNGIHDNTSMEIWKRAAEK